MKGHLDILVSIETLPVLVCSTFVHGSFYELTNLAYSTVLDLDCTVSFPDIAEVLRINKRKCARTLR